MNVNKIYQKYKTSSKISKMSILSDVDQFDVLCTATATSSTFSSQRAQSSYIDKCEALSIQTPGLSKRVLGMDVSIDAIDASTPKLK